MATAEGTQAPAGSVHDGDGATTGSRRWAWGGLAIVLAGGLGLRLWGIGQGLPYAYNADEADHFVPHAIEMFGQHSLNPHYFANPPAYTYVLHYLFAIAYGGTAGVQHAIAPIPQTSIRSPVPPRQCSERWRCGCCTALARGCSAAAWGCWRRRSRRSRSCRSSTRTWRSTTCPRSRR